MTIQEFNLKKSRYELVRVLREDFGIHNSKAWSIMKKVEEQDKEFIKLLKKDLLKMKFDESKYSYKLRICKRIDKLAGKDLI